MPFTKANTFVANKRLAMQSFDPQNSSLRRFSRKMGYSFLFLVFFLKLGYTQTNLQGIVIGHKEEPIIGASIAIDKAFKQNSVDYLLKPIDKGELQQAIQKFKSIYTPTSPNLNIEAINQLLNAQNKAYKDRIKVKVGDHLRIFKMEEIPLIYSESKTTFIMTAKGRSFPIDQTLDQLVKELDPSKFYRVNRSHIISIDFIIDVIAYSNSRLKVVIKNNNPSIIVARERVKAFKDWLG